MVLVGGRAGAVNSLAAFVVDLLSTDGRPGRSKSRSSKGSNVAVVRSEAVD